MENQRPARANPSRGNEQSEFCRCGGMVYTHDLKSCPARDVGSSPTAGIIIKFLGHGENRTSRIEVLQTSALPLGYVAKIKFLSCQSSTQSPSSCPTQKRRRQKFHSGFCPKIIFKKSVLFVKASQNFPLLIFGKNTDKKLGGF